MDYPHQVKVTTGLKLIYTGIDISVAETIVRLIKQYTELDLVYIDGEYPTTQTQKVDFYYDPQQAMAFAFSLDWISGFIRGVSSTLVDLRKQGERPIM